jgi:small-conductance mechanosensitive channel
MKLFKGILLVVAFSLSILVGWAQGTSDSLVHADSTVKIFLSNSDTVLVHSTDTVIVVVEIPVANQTLRLPKTPEDKEKVDPSSVLKVISFGKIIWSIIFLLFTYLIIRGLAKLLNIIAERSARYRITVKGFIPIIRVTGWILAVYIVVSGVINPPAETIIAVAASIGIAVGFAAQDILKNIFGGLIIIIDRPFKVGDKVEIGKYYGEVIEIGLRSTQVVTPDDSLVSVPNGEVMNQSVSNANAGEPNCQVVSEIYLPITVDTEVARKIALEAAQVSKYIYLNKPVKVLFSNEVHQRRSYLKMRLKAYVLDIRDEFNFKSDMTEIVLRELIDQKVINPEELY